MVISFVRLSLLSLSLIWGSLSFAQSKQCSSCAKKVDQPMSKISPLAPKPASTYVRAQKAVIAPATLNSDNSKQNRIVELEFYRDQYTDPGTRAKYQAAIDALN